jgi:hypothetical protein
MLQVNGLSNETGVQMSRTNFERHLFISYAHLDDHPLTPEQLGWITRLHGSLEAMLGMRMGRKPDIWRDRKLNGNDIFTDEIVQQFPKTAILLSVLTPRYLESEWCIREVNEFCKAAEGNGGVRLGNQSRVFKLIKTPVDSEKQLPDVMKGATGYPFYSFDDDGAPLELDPVYGDEPGQKYNVKVAKLAWDIALFLKKLEANTDSREHAGSGTAACKMSIYLAECSYDRREAREALESELKMHGYAVLPDRQLPTDEAGYIAEVRRLLAQCKLSIHLVGASWGAAPDGASQKSVVVLQNELAIEQSKRAALPRIIWLREGTQCGFQPQQEFIEKLQKDAETQFGADVIAGDLAALKEAVHAALKKLEQAAPPKADSGRDGDSRLIYLICEERDRESTKPVRKFLRQQGFEVKIPVFEGDAAAVRTANQDLLSQCDAVLLFYGAGDEAWNHTAENELRKMKGYRGGKPLLANYKYLAEPATDDKKELIELEPNVVDGLKGFSEKAMEAFVKAVRR